jgi:hypothetical protein
MMKTSLGIGIALGLLAASPPAHALKQTAHRKISFASCKAAGLPAEFCRRVGAENYNTDASEWDDLAAHAQVPDGVTPCQAADRSIRRMWSLGGELRAALAGVRDRATDRKVGDAARAIGRALHTLQDSCAHSGMGNPQHAWYSLADFCDGTSTSPDVQPEALSCGRAESDKLLPAVAQTIRGTGTTAELGARACPQPSIGGDHGPVETICDREASPSPGDACDFLAEAKTWDGVDRVWKNSRVLPALRKGFTDGLAGKPAPAPICGGDETRLSSGTSELIEDVSDGPPGCSRAEVYCLGKVDDPSAADDLFGDEGELGGAGCAVDGGGAGGLIGLALLGLAARLGRRRRR